MAIGLSRLLQEGALRSAIDSHCIVSITRSFQIRPFRRLLVSLRLPALGLELGDCCSLSCLPHWFHRFQITKVSCSAANISCLQYCLQRQVGLVWTFR